MHLSGTQKILLGFACGIVLVSSALAAAHQRVEGVRTILENGNPGLTIRSAHVLLKNRQIDNQDRRQLLELIARAEEMRTSFHNYSDVSQATRAWASLLKEFPSDKHAAAIRWRIAWLYWRQGNLPKAEKAAESILAKHPAAREAEQVKLLLARIDIKRNRLHAARKRLLQYMLGVKETSAAQARGLAWLAIVDFSEHRLDVALKGMKQALHLSPGIITGNAELQSVYVRLLDTQGHVAEAMREAKSFLKRHIETPYAPRIRLIHADLLAQKGKSEEALAEYGQLSETEAENSIGKKAFMRKLMLQNIKTGNIKSLRPVLAALQRMAARNQLSDIEAESLLDQAQLWERLSGKVKHAAEKALTLYAQTTTDHYPSFSVTATRKGALLLRQQLKKQISGKKWLQTVVLWQRFPQLRNHFSRKSKQDGDAINIQLGVAHAMRMLMQFNAAETMLKRLYRQAKGSITGQRVMLDLSLLWLDRGDAGGFSRVMRWLDDHEFTLYRPDLLLVAASMQLAKGKINAASQTLHTVSPEDLALETRPIYWRTEARVDEALSRWHLAAHAWKNYRKYNPSEAGSTGMHQANALFKAEEFAAAEKTYLTIPKAMRLGEWQYRMALTEYQTGKWGQAKERLQKLAENKDAGEYANMARLELADQRAQALLERQ